MPITYDITKDFAYKKGEERGREIGEKRGKEIGEKKGETKLISNMIRSGKMTLEQIAEVTQVPVKEVQKIARKLGE